MGKGIDHMIVQLILANIKCIDCCKVLQEVVLRFIKLNYQNKASSKYLELFANVGSLQVVSWVGWIGAIAIYHKAEVWDVKPPRIVLGIKMRGK